MSELKPCPFCGSTNWSLWYDGAYYCVACVDCEAQGSKGKTRDEAVEAWNKREEYLDFDEWCDDCKEYDHERHCCPRWNRVIRDTVKEVTEPRKGKWIKDRLSSTCGGSYGVYRCSECASSYQDIGYGWNYCPNCGARMEAFNG